MNSFLTFVNLLFIVVDIALVGLFVFSFVKSLQYRPSFDLEKKKAKKILRLREAITEEHWRSIAEKFSEGTPESWRGAIIAADALVDNTLQELGIRGAHLIDRIANLETEELETEDKVIVAHRLRADLEGKPGFVLSADDARFAFGAYEAFLKELGLLR